MSDRRRERCNEISRRGFLRSAAAMAAPVVLPSGVLASPTGPGANDRVVLGAIGVGNMGAGLARRFHGLNTRIAAIADVDRVRAEEVAESVDARYVCQDYRRLLDRKDIDAVVVATPHHWHALHCIHAAQAGKDIFCEKPLTYCIREGRSVVEAVRKYGRVFQTGSQQRSGEAEYQGIMHVRNGSLGKVNRVLATNYHSPMEHGHPAEPVPAGLDWRMWCGPAGEHPYNFVVFDNRSDPSWVSIRPFSGGEMSDWGSHGLDIAQWGLGMDESGPLEVWTEGEPFQPIVSTPERPGGRHRGPSLPKVLMKYSDDVVMELDGGPAESGVCFVGEKGSIAVTRGRVEADPPDLVAGPVESLPEQLDRSLDHYRNWLECIKDRRDPIAHAEVGHRTATVCHLGNIARWVSSVTGETGRILKWDPRAERFTNSDVANGFVDYSRHPPYSLPEKV